MCNHVYVNAKRIAQKKTICGCANFLSNLIGNDIFSQFDLTLPIDNTGKCLFHSTDNKWKSENNFRLRFNELLEICIIHRTLNQKSYFDFSEFYFGTERNFELKNKDFDFVATFDFTGATFESFLVLENLKTNVTLDFNGAIFYEGVLIKNSSFDAINFENIVSERKFNISNSEIKYDSFFNNAEFLGLASFYNTVFHGDVHFTNTLFTIEETIAEFDIPMISFKSVVFKRDAIFEYTIFEVGVEFPNTVFDGKGDFFATKFSDDLPTDFSNIIVNRSLVFKGKDISKKIFRHNTFFRIKSEDIKGQIIFENANFIFIATTHKQILRSLVQEQKVIIGSNCEKYAMTSDIRNCQVDKDMQYFITEYTNIFANFFSSEESIILGIEIIERNDVNLLFYYFTDENITKGEFERKLGITEEKMVNMMMGKQDAYQQENSNQQAEIQIVNDNKISEIRRLDTIINLMGLMFKIGIRNSFTNKDIENLLKSVNFSQNIPAPQIVYNIIIGNYTRKTFNRISQTINGDNNRQDIVM